LKTNIKFYLILILALTWAAASILIFDSNTPEMPLYQYHNLLVVLAVGPVFPFSIYLLYFTFLNIKKKQPGTVFLFFLLIFPIAAVFLFFKLLR
jgi:hypothetical protein